MSLNSGGARIRKGPLPPSNSPSWANDAPKGPEASISKNTQFKLTAACLVFLSAWFAWTLSGPAGSSFLSGTPTPRQPSFSFQQQQDILGRCAAFRTPPGPPSNFLGRDKSDRFEPGTNATLIRNAWIWTGLENGTVSYRGDILLDQGIVKAIGDIPARTIEDTKNLTTVDAEGKWVTPGLVDMHSHLGILSSPILGGAVDLDSTKGPILPYLRAVDGLNTHDAGFQIAMAGGVTTVQVLPGSNNAIGGQSFFVKLRPTSDRSAVSMIVDPPTSLTGESPGWRAPTRWRHMKQACGENLRRYGNRMDTMWSFRSAYAQAAKVKAAQDLYCEKAEAGLWDTLDPTFPEDLRWEMLVDVLRGKVKISNHCYEAVDMDALVRLTNEFKFHIASFHHAAEAWLVPDVLKRTWGGIPTVALFATNYRFKREAFRGSEFAPRVLADEGIPVVLKSDHPVINSRYLAYEAQQAHYFGLPSHLALAAITSTPATTAGLGHRIGILQKGADADVVLWDSHPLNFGATPMKVWIDGLLQIPVPSKDGVDIPVEVGKGKEGDRWRRVPSVPNWDKEREAALRWEGLPPLPGRSSRSDRVVFTNVKSLWTRTKEGKIQQGPGNGSAAMNDAGSLQTLVFVKGKLSCIGSTCSAEELAGSETVDLQGGSISPGLMTYGSTLGLGEIMGEPSTQDGDPADALTGNVPRLMDDVGGLVRAVDTLVFQTRDALTAYRSGVTLATSSLAKPVYLNGPGSRFLSGLSVAFRTGSSHAMEKGAIVQDVVALHVVLGRAQPMAGGGVSVSTQMAALRRLLYGWESQDKETGHWFRKAAEGVIPLVIEVDSADIMASLLILKADVEDRIGSRMRMVFAGAAEAHLLAREISTSEVGVILNPARPYPMVWDQRRILPGPPLTNDTALVKLLEEGVVVGLGIRSSWEARHARYDANWASLESNGRIREDQAYALVTTDLENLLGIRDIGEETADLVATQGGGLFDQSSKVVGVISAQRGYAEVF